MSLLRYPPSNGRKRVPRWASPVVVSGLPPMFVFAMLSAMVALFGSLLALAASGALTGGGATERWAGRIGVTVGVVSSTRLVGTEWWRLRGPRLEVGYEYRPETGAPDTTFEGNERVEARLFSAIRPGDAIEVFYLAEKPRESRILLQSGGSRGDALALLFGLFLLVSCYVLAANVAASAQTRHRRR